MTRKGFLALAFLPFIGRKKPKPSAGIALANAGRAAIKALKEHILVNGGNITVRGEDLYVLLKNNERR